MSKRKFFSCMIDFDLWYRLQSTKARTGLCLAEQGRRAIRMWLDSRDWPVRPVRKRASPHKGEIVAAADLSPRVTSQKRPDPPWRR